MLEIELPYPPSINHYWRRVGYRTILSRGGRAFRRAVYAVLAAQGVRPLAGRLAVEIDMYPPDCRRRDIDNILKSLLDALQHGGAYFDDSQVVRLVIVKQKPVTGGKIVIRILQERR